MNGEYVQEKKRKRKVALGVWRLPCWGVSVQRSSPQKARRAEFKKIVTVPQHPPPCVRADVGKLYGVTKPRRIAPRRGKGGVREKRREAPPPVLCSTVPEGVSAPRHAIVVVFRGPDGDHAARAKRGHTTAQAHELRGILRVVLLALRR